MILSKHVAHAKCADVLHPWTGSCTHAWGTILVSASSGSCKLFLPIILVEFVLKLLKKKKINKEIISELLDDYLQCITVTTCATTMFMVFSCTLRYLLKKFNYYSIVFFPSLIAGLSFALFKPKLRVQILTALGNAALETLLLNLSHCGLLPLNKYTETLFFMVTNACLMYTFQLSRSHHFIYSWFFKPDKDGPKNDDKLFLKKLFKKMGSYFGLGFGYGIVRALVGDMTILRPRNIHNLFKIGTLKAGIFASSYVAIYELTVYILYRYFRKNRLAYALPAGFLAGISYVVDPNLPVNISVFINLVQILYKLNNTQFLRRIPMDIILFCFSLGILLHLLFIHPKIKSKVGSKILQLTSGRRYNLIIAAIEKLNSNVI